MARCFVVQGFGRKTNYVDGRELDLDASYAVIKEAVEAAGHECLRADEIKHSGTIDQPMYEHLLRSELVIADLSTQNINAAFELGVRYGLRPHATIIVAEEGFRQNFDVSHLMIRRYKHLGEDIGRKEAARFKQELQDAMAEIVGAAKVDSPVYTFLSHLLPPQERSVAEMAADLAAPAPGEPAPDNAASQSSGDSRTAKVLLELALAWIASAQPSDFVGARVLLEILHDQRPNDRFVIHQMALATYRSEQPTPLDALKEACDQLSPLLPQTTNNPETLSLWAAIHRRMWDLEQRPEQLAESIHAYSRSFHVKQDSDSGLNLARLLELRALQSARAGERDEAIADRVLARRVRQDILRYVAPQLDDLDELRADKRYWMLASLWEVNSGLGRAAAATRWEEEARAAAQSNAMVQTTEQHIAKTRETQAALDATLAAPV
jgi:hypothetical protein